MNKRKIGKKQVIILILIILVNLLGYLYITQSDNYVSNKVKEFKPEISKKIAKENKAKTDKANYDFSKVESVSDLDILKARQNTDKILFIGYVSIPDIGLTVPISMGTDNYNMALGAGTMFPEQEMGKGNYPLASHYMKTDKSLLFIPIVDKGETGQKIYLTDLDKVYEYTTDVHEVVDVKDGSLLNYDEGGKARITLITCNVESEWGRVIQQGYLTETYDWKDAPKDVTKTMVNTTKDN